ncbi:uncharacterized protein LOC111990333 [Quercus suber]|uniref:uncharacterized protein LOC111990333 n=1 Tax=Quercus suber TaxID=58331 RepID=UPI000CE25E52|nr:uncharacterized protein LOC111990333 [Quercus suber]
MCDAVDPGNSSKHHGVDLTQSDWDMKVDKGGDVSNHPLGANKPNFSNNVSDMIRRHCPAIMIISETKLYGIRAQNIIDRLPFDGAIVTNSFGRSGGLWLLWDSDQVEVSELSSTEQEIRALVIAGDFNEVLMSGDKSGGNVVSISRALRFQDCLNMCNMIDMGFAGPCFTWSNHKPLTQLVQERIDRVFVNPVWNNLHPEAAVLHLEKTHSDHCPIKLLFNRLRDNRASRPFRFQPIWLSHPSFQGVVCDAWSSLPTLQQAVESFSEKARIWNRSHFGNLFQRKNRVLARLKGIQESLTASPSTHLINLEKMLRGEFAEVAKLEEEFWAMKSRILWLVEKDRNTSFYHIAALVRRRRNRIVCLKDRMGNWINGDREISEFIREDFSDLFTSGVTVSSLAEWHPPCWHICIKEAYITNIDRRL